MAIKHKKKRNPVEASLERLYRIAEKRLTSLPEEEGMKRLKSIDAAHSQAREQDSKTRASQRNTQDHPVVCPGDRSGRL